jgi:hypothetical protein
MSDKSDSYAAGLESRASALGALAVSLEALAKLPSEDAKAALAFLCHWYGWKLVTD